MDIIIVSAQYIGSVSGGGGVHVVELTRELGKLGHKVTVISMGLGKYKNKEEIILEDPYNPDKKKRKVKINVIRFRVKDSDRLKSPFEGTKQQEIDRLIEFKNKVIDYLIKYNGKEVLHIHGHFVIPSMAKELKEAKTRYRIVNSIHTVESISEIKKGKDGAGLKFIRIMQDMEKNAILYSDNIIFRSQKVKQQVSEFFPEAVKKVRISIRSSGVSSLFIHHPAQEDKILEKIKKKYNVKGDLILNINRIDPSKGIENLIKAYPKLYIYLRKIKNKDYKLSLVIAGMIEEKNQWYYKRLLKLINGIKDAEIKKSISIHHDIPEEDKIGLFDIAKVFVLPSLLEPFGITVVEALAKNIPVVASGVEGPMDIMDIKKVKSPFTPAQGGVLVDYEKVSKRSDNLFEGLKYIYNNPEKVKQSVLQGKKKTLRKYAWESLVQEKLEIYYRV